MMTTWYDEMLVDVERLLGMLDQIGAYDDKHRPYSTVSAELRADAFVPVQRAVVESREPGACREGDAARRRRRP